METLTTTVHLLLGLGGLEGVVEKLGNLGQEERMRKSRFGTIGI